MTREQMIDELRRLSPAERRRVLDMARVIRLAREAGDARPAKAIIAPILARAHKTVH